MPPDCAFMAQIMMKYEGVPLLKGSGMLVTPDHVLTCAHVVLDIPAETWDPGRDNLRIFDVMVNLETDSQTPVHRRANIVAYDRPDIALLRLDRPVDARPLSFVSGLRVSHIAEFARAKASVIGFSKIESGQLVQCPVEGSILPVSSLTTGQPLNIQMGQGLSSGMSGGPLLLKVKDQWFCAGMAYLGGNTSAVSRLILSDVLLEFLGRHNLDCFAIPASDCFPETLGKFIERRRLLQRSSYPQLAKKLGIAESTVRNWELDLNVPACEYAERLYDLLIHGDPQATEEWRRLNDRHGLPSPPDILAELRPIATPGALSAEIVNGRRTFGLKPRPKYPRFRIHSEVKITADLPWSAHATFLLIQGTESTLYSCYCLDPLLGMADRMPAGPTTLPPGDGSLPVGEPPSRNCLVVLTQRTAALHWSQQEPEDLQTPFLVPATEIAMKIREFASLGADEVFASFYEFEVHDGMQS